MGRNLSAVLLVLLSFVFETEMFGLIPKRAIVATDKTPMYVEFWPLVSKAWNTLGIKPTLALIGDDTVQVDESLGDVLRFRPLPGIPTSFYAQVIRLLVPVLYPNETCILSDMDMLPISATYFSKITASIPDDCFVVYNDKAYKKGYRQYPICYNAAKGSVFKEIFDVSSIDDIPSKVLEWYAFGLGWTTDEIMLYGLLRQWNGYPNKVRLLGYTAGNQRIDRGNWHFDPVLLKAGYYIDSHMLRPYSRYKCTIDILLRALGLLT